MKAWLSISITLVACGTQAEKAKPRDKTLDELKKDWGVKVSAKLDKVVAAAKAADAAELGAPGDAKLELDFAYGDAKTHPNAIAVQVDDVQSATAPRPPPPKPQSSDEIWKAAERGEVPDIKVPPEVPHPARFAFQDDRANHVYNAKALLGIESDTFAYPDHVYDQLVNAKYVLVVTPSEVTWPDIGGMTFKTGHVKLRAVLVEIDTAKPLGGFETVAENSDEVLVKDLSDKKDVVPKLDRDFLASSSAAIVHGIEQRWPGAKTPLDWGVRTW